MNKITLLVVVITASFLSGFAVHHLMTSPPPANNKKGKATGIGGVFFKCQDPKKMREWYHDQLGFNTNSYGAMFEWYEQPDSTKKGKTQWSPFPQNTNYFNPSQKDFMINYRVDNLSALVEELRKNKVTIVDTIETYDYGKFIHIMDPEGNKIELWEPKD